MGLPSFGFTATFGGIMVILSMFDEAIRAQNSAENFVSAHNSARDEVGVGAIAWDETVASYARNYANERASDCLLVHSQTPLYGENIYVGSGEGYSDGSDAVRYWYAEKAFYDYESNVCIHGAQCLHYTQMVWRHSVSIGCARVECVLFPGSYFITCNYHSPGNIFGQRPY